MIPDKIQPNNNNIDSISLNEGHNTTKQSPIHEIPNEVLRVILSSFDNLEALQSQHPLWQKLITPDVVKSVYSNEIEHCKQTLLKDLDMLKEAKLAAHHPSQEVKAVEKAKSNVSDFSQKEIFKGVNLSQVKESGWKAQDELASKLGGLALTDYAALNEKAKPVPIYKQITELAFLNYLIDKINRQ
jgi:hypothetical protein